jgi:hypothetical protein
MTKAEATSRLSKVLALILFLIVIAATVVATQAADQAQCEGAWLKADANRDGRLQPEEIANLAPAKTGDDAAVMMTEAEFMDACKKGMFDSIFTPQQ